MVVLLDIRQTQRTERLQNHFHSKIKINSLLAYCELKGFVKSCTSEAKIPLWGGGLGACEILARAQLTRRTSQALHDSCLLSGDQEVLQVIWPAAIQAFSVH